MARIKEVIRRHYSSWRKLPAAPDPDPFILLANDLFALQCILESEIWDDAARRAYGMPLSDPKFPTLVEAAYSSLCIYVDFRQEMVGAAPPQPTPDWLRSASRALIQELRELLGPLKRLKAALKV